MESSAQKKLKVLFIGGTERALITFRSLLERKDIELVLAIFMPGYPDERTYAESLEGLAQAQQIPYAISDKVEEELLQKAKAAQPDVILGGGVWRSYLPTEFLDFSAHGYLGLHGSGLPRYRGWAGLSWYLINGEPEYEMRMLQLNAEYDAGPLVANEKGEPLEYRISLQNEWHLAELMQKAHEVTVNALHETIDLLLSGKFQLVPQDATQASYTCHRGPEDGEIDWTQTTREVFNFIRAQSAPYPGAYTYFRGEKVHLWRVQPAPELSNYIGRIPGKVVERDSENRQVVILTQDSGIRVLEAACKVKDLHDPYLIFNSVRHKCKDRVNAYLDKIGYD
ncbi:MAG: methionyl-tRNA formyltransferase [Salibacteraceae bacterium]